MENSDYIISVNKDESAPIFQISHVAAQGDIYEVVARLSEKLKGGRNSHV
jgi:electron transfer flavoprotein alpha subunit